MLHDLHAAHHNPRLCTLYHQHGQRVRRAVNRIKAGLTASVLAVAACSSPSPLADARLPILEDYPVSINATAARGSLHLQPDGCLVFTRSDGARMLPVFRPGSTIDALQKRLGKLTTPRPVTVMGMTIMRNIPPVVARFTLAHGCSQTPFVFGNFGEPADLPPAPPAVVPTRT